MTTANITLDQPRHTLFTPVQVFGATMLGTEFAGAFLLSRTAHRLEAPEVAHKAWVRAIVLVVGRGVASYFFPAVAGLLAISAAVHYHRFAKTMVQRSVEDHRDAGGPIAPTLTVVGYGLAFLLGQLLVLLAML